MHFTANSRGNKLYIFGKEFNTAKLKYEFVALNGLKKKFGNLPVRNNRKSTKSNEKTRFSSFQCTVSNLTKPKNNFVTLLVQNECIESKPFETLSPLTQYGHVQSTAQQKGINFAR